MYQKWVTYGTLGAHLIEIRNGCARYDQLASRHSFPPPFMSPPGSRGRKAKKAYCLNFLMFWVVDANWVSQLDALAKDSEGENEAEAISWGFLKVFCYHARHWKDHYPGSSFKWQHWCNTGQKFCVLVSVGATVEVRPFQLLDHRESSVFLNSRPNVGPTATWV